MASLYNQRGWNSNAAPPEMFCREMAPMEHRSDSDNYDDRTPEQFRNWSTESPQANRGRQPAGFAPARRDFWAFQTPDCHSGNLFPRIEANYDCDYRPDMPPIRPPPVRREMFSDFRPIGPMHDAAAFPNGGNRGFRGRRFQNRGSYPRRGDWSHSPRFWDRFPTSGFGPPLERGGRSESFFFRGGRGGPKWRSTYLPRPAEGYDNPQFGNVDQFTDNFNDREPPFQDGRPLPRFSNQDRWVGSCDRRPDEPAHWRTEPQCPNDGPNFAGDVFHEEPLRNMLPKQETDRFYSDSPPLNRFDLRSDNAPLVNSPPFRPPLFNGPHRGDLEFGPCVDQNFADDVVPEDIPRRREPERFYDDEQPIFNRFGLRSNDDAPPCAINSNPSPFRPMFDNRPCRPDCNTDQPRATSDAEFRQPRLQGPRNKAPFRTNRRSDDENARFPRKRLNTRLHLRGMRKVRPGFPANRRSTLSVNRARRTLALLNLRRGSFCIRRLQGRLRMRGPRSWRNLRNSFHDDENSHPDDPYWRDEDEDDALFVPGFPDGRPIPRNKLRNFDLEDTKEDEAPPAEEDWDALPPAPPFIIGRYINKGATFMIANATPKRKRNPNLDSPPPDIAPAEVIDIVDDSRDCGDRGTDPGEQKVDLGGFYLDVKPACLPDSLFGPVDSNPVKRSQTPEFLIELSETSDDDSGSCEMIGDFSSRSKPKAEGTSLGEPQIVDVESDLEVIDECERDLVLGDDFQEVDLRVEEDSVDYNYRVGDDEFEGDHDGDDLRGEERYSDGEDLYGNASGDEVGDNAPVGDSRDVDASGGDSHDGNYEGRRFNMNDAAYSRDIKEEESLRMSARREDSRGDALLPSGSYRESHQREDSDEESVHEVDLLNIHPDPDCPEDFLDIDDSPGALPIPTGENQANRPDATRKRVYNGPAPPGLTAPPSPHDFTWVPCTRRPQKKLPPKHRGFTKRSHLIKMHHQSPSYDILHQVFPDDCN